MGEYPLMHIMGIHRSEFARSSYSLARRSLFPRGRSVPTNPGVDGRGGCGLAITQDDRDLLRRQVGSSRSKGARSICTELRRKGFDGVHPRWASANSPDAGPHWMGDFSPDLCGEVRRKALRRHPRGSFAAMHQSQDRQVRRGIVRLSPHGVQVRYRLTGRLLPTSIERGVNSNTCLATIWAVQVIPRRDTRWLGTIWPCPTR
jgi:hypothetical protein